VKVKHPIRLAHKLILLVILTAGITVVLPSVLVIGRVTKALNEHVSELMASEARLGAAEVGRALRISGRVAQAMAGELADINQQADLRETAVRRWLASNSDIIEVAFLPADDATAAWRSVRDGPTTPGAEGLNLSNTTMRSYYGVDVGVRHDPEADDVLIVAAPTPAPLAGRLVLLWRLAGLSDPLRELNNNRSAYAFVVDHKGYLLAHPEYGGEAADGPAHARIGLSQRHLEVVQTTFDTRTPPLTTYTDATGQRVVARGVYMEELDWVVIAQQPEARALRAVQEIKEDVLLVGTTAGLVAILLGLAIVGTITRPLEELAEAANRVGAGDLTHPVGVATKDEIGALSLSFNEMQIRLREMYDKLERMVAERTHELEETGDFLNSVLDSSTEYSIIATDLHGTILSYNEGARRIYGYEPEEIIGAPVRILIPREDEELEKAREILKHVRREGTYSGETLRVCKGGRRFPARFVMTTRYDDVGNPAGYTTISRDITQQKEMEAQLLEYTGNLEALVASKTGELQDANVELERANRLKAEFLASMSHELRTPLNAIIGFAGVLRDEMAGGLNEDQKQFVGDIFKSGEQLLNLINDILDLSKVEAGKMELVPEDVILSGIFDEVQTIVQGMAVRKGLSLSFREEPPGIVLTADRVKLLQILYNLLSNSVKFTPDDGTIRVEAERRDADTCFRIIDSGVGIPEDSLELIFEEFRQVDSQLSRQYSGTGLGLALTKKLVALHGGTVAVESEVDKGSVFTFTIPHVLPVDEGEGSLFTSPTG
jgi:PAS domain S-box-containing protein